MYKWITILIAFMALNGCQNKEYAQFECLSEDYRQILRLSENEFKSKLNIKYDRKNEKENLIQFLSEISQSKNPNLKPSTQLSDRFYESPVANDIWNKDKTPNLNGKFVNCLSKSRSRFLKQYHTSLIQGGDMSPTVTAEGLINYLNKNKMNDYIYLIATVNFYLINLN